MTDAISSSGRYFNSKRSAIVLENENQFDLDGKNEERNFLEENEQFVNELDLSKYKRYSRINKTVSQNYFVDQKLENAQLKAANAITRAAIHDSLSLNQNIGSIEVDPKTETTLAITQEQILAQSSIATKEKHFELYLPENGPYISTYSPGGKQLLLVGQMGHIANFDWRNKYLTSEINVTERIRDCCWLQNDTMFAVSQKRYTYVYDKKGVELHCLKRMDFIEHLDFMPYHFLLFGINDLNYLTYFDVSTGKLVSSKKAYTCKALTMDQNKSTGVTYLGHANGVVTMWSPNSDKPLATILCHKASLSSIRITNDGLKMITTSKDKQLCVYDTRSFKCLQRIQLREFIEPVTSLSCSQTDMVACGSKCTVKIFKPNPIKGMKLEAYLQNDSPGPIKSLEFCPFEDVLGIGHYVGFHSIIIPGSGNMNFDTTEANPNENKKMRKNQEIKRMIEKINHEMIDPDIGAIGKVNVKSLRENIIERNKVSHIKKKDISIGTMKNKTRGKGSAANTESRKQAIFDQQLKEKMKLKALKEKKNSKLKNSESSKNSDKTTSKDPLSIFN